jgi:hypothetical protein
MRRWPVVLLVVGLVALTGPVAFAQEDAVESMEEGEAVEAVETPEAPETPEAAEPPEEVYLDEDYDERNRWALGFSVGLVELGDNVIDGERLVSGDDVEPYFSVSARIPFGDRDANFGSARGGFQGYLEPEIGYWDGDQGSDTMLGLNIIGGMPYNAVEFFLGGGIGVHFIDVEFDDLDSFDSDSDTALGVNAQFGVDVSMSKNVSFFGVGRFDLVDDDRDELESKASVGIRFRF